MSTPREPAMLAGRAPLRARPPDRPGPSTGRAVARSSEPRVIWQLAHAAGPGPLRAPRSPRGPTPFRWFTSASASIDARSRGLGQLLSGPSSPSRRVVQRAFQNKAGRAAPASSARTPTGRARCVPSPASRGRAGAGESRRGPPPPRSPLAPRSAGESARLIPVRSSQRHDLRHGDAHLGPTSPDGAVGGTFALSFNQASTRPLTNACRRQCLGRRMKWPERVSPSSAAGAARARAVVCR